MDVTEKGLEHCQNGSVSFKIDRAGGATGVRTYMYVSHINNLVSPDFSTSTMAMTNLAVLSTLVNAITDICTSALNESVGH